MKTILTVLCLLSLAACTQNGYKLNFNLSGNVTKVVLRGQTGTGTIALDSVILKNGQGQLSGKIPQPDLYYLEIDNKNPSKYIFLENSNITVSGKVDSVLIVKGSKTHDQFRQIQDQLSQLQLTAKDLFQQSVEKSKAGLAQEADTLSAQSHRAYALSYSKMKEFIQSHPNSPITPLYISMQFDSYEEKGLNDYLKALDKSLSELGMVKELNVRLEKMRRLAIGNPAPEFEMSDPNGKLIKLKEVYSKNKYTLIDFWASWCGGCRAENPNVVDQYNQYKDRGFTVLGVSLDENQQQWKQAFEKDQLSWIQVNDPKRIVADQYAVFGIPSNFLVDCKGAIVAKNLIGDELNAKLAELFK